MNSRLLALLDAGQSLRKPWLADYISELCQKQLKLVA